MSVFTHTSMVRVRHSGGRDRLSVTIRGATPILCRSRTRHFLSQGYRQASYHETANASPHTARLLAHLRRWKDRKLIATCFVEFNGKPVASVKRGSKQLWNSPACPGESRLTLYVTPPQHGSCSAACRSGKLLGSWACRQRSCKTPTATSTPTIFITVRNPG